MQQSSWMKVAVTSAGMALFVIAASAATGVVAQSTDWVPLGSLHDRVYVMNKPSLTAIPGGFMFGVITDKSETVEPDALPDGRKYRSSFLTVEVNCSEATFRIPRARFFSGSHATGDVIAEDQVPPGEGWAPAQPESIGAAFVSAACPGK
jgi:hypothetical protein